MTHSLTTALAMNLMRIQFLFTILVGRIRTNHTEKRGRRSGTNLGSLGGGSHILEKSYSRMFDEMGLSPKND